MLSNSRPVRFRAAAALTAVAAVAALGIASTPAALATELPAAPVELTGSTAAQEKPEDSPLRRAFDSALDEAREQPAEEEGIEPQAATEGEAPSGADQAGDAAAPETVGDAGPGKTSADVLQGEAVQETPAGAATQQPVREQAARPQEAGYTVSGSVWGDYYGDGDYSPGLDEWAAGIEVQLLAKDGTRVRTAVTDAAGQYAFENLDAGTYRLRFPSVDDVGFSFDLDDDGYTPSFELGPEQTSVTFDLALFVPEDWPSLTFAAYVDADRDGIFDDDEAGAPDVDVEILSEDGSLAATATTDENGMSGGWLDEGRYRLRLAVPEGYAVSGAEAYVYPFEDEGPQALGIDPDGLTDLFEVDGEYSAIIAIGLAEADAAAPAAPDVEPAAMNPAPVSQPAAARSAEPQSAEATAPQLAYTGSTATALAPLAALALAAGAVLLWLVRRKPAA
ncbi:SdrD B-like domain-containing protein [Arthrobacter sp. USHLN218]|uniref:SdrD B-like domain-containing protein n=1 Tax=Arthrobacter sp. USHLN218 TaxID=3081232 RepID=UPI00301A2FF8